jgi:hypothetical protein
MIWTQEEAKTQHQCSPKLAELLGSIFPKEIMIVDYGCGLGFYVDALRRQGFTTMGFEGTPGIDGIAIVEGVAEKDLSKPLDFFPTASNSLSLEVGEYISAEHEAIFLENITRVCTGKLVLSWAVPGQGGNGHINERSNDYIVEKLYDLGFELNEKETTSLRLNMVNDPCWWFKNTLMVFDRKPYGL